jgi:hypothetical protein
VLAEPRLRNPEADSDAVAMTDARQFVGSLHLLLGAPTAGVVWLPDGLHRLWVNGIYP